MSTLSKHGRASLPGKDFAGKGRTYPVENRAHAEAAILDAGVAAKKGRMSQAEKLAIDRRARAELRKSDKG